MNWFKRLKVGAKLILGFTTMILFMVVIGLVGFVSTKNVESNLAKIFELNLPSIDYLLQADRDFQQLLVAERSMIFSNAKSDVFKGLVKEYEEKLKQSRQGWEKYKAIASTPEEKAIIPQFEKANKEWEVISRRVVDGRIADTREGRREALDLSLGIAKQKFEVMRNPLDKLIEINQKMAKEVRRQSGETYKNAVIFILTVIVIGLFVGIFLMWALASGVTKPLKAIIEGLSVAAFQVTTGSSQVASSSQALAEGASEQAASIEETSASIEELASMTRANANSANEAKGMMGTASQIVAKVNTHMGEMSEAINEITKTSEETGKIIKTIDEIAFQTNLLALNAAVEAARAGEAGAGFAVVADEVRNLAMRAAEAAKNTSDLIEGTIKAVKNGSELTASTRESFKENVDISGKVAALVEEITSASNEQARGIEQVNKAISEMDSVVQRVAANAEESSSVSEEMSAQASQMNEIVVKLTAMVGGGTGGRASVAVGEEKQSFNPQIFPARRSALQASPSSSEKALEKENQTKEVHPEKVIPMEEEDFTDF